MKDVSKFIDNTPIWNEVKKITSAKAARCEYTYKGMVHTVKEDIQISKLLYVDTVRDYVENIGDVIFVQFIVPLGDYVKRIYPYRDNLEFSIKKVSPTKEDKPVIYRYKAIFLESENRQASDSEVNSMSHEVLNISDIVEVKFQLLDVSLELLRIATVSGIFMNQSREDLIHSILYSVSSDFKIKGKKAIDGIDIFPPDNKGKITQMVIKDGTEIHTVPNIVHARFGGLYASGLGTYFQIYNNLKYWFVYPIGNVDRFKGKEDKMIFYAIPDKRLNQTEKTYRKESGTTHVIVTGAKIFSHNSEISYMNNGVGYRSSDADAFMKKPVEMTEDGPKALRNRLNTEHISKDRSDNLNYAPVSRGQNNSLGIMANQFLEYSKVNLRRLTRVEFIWENSDASLIYPGMPCKYVFTHADKSVELKGVIVGVHDTISVTGSKFTSEIYRNHASVTILVEPNTVIPKTSESKPHGKF